MPLRFIKFGLDAGKQHSALSIQHLVPQKKPGPIQLRNLTPEC
jgi:hypothetical protein